MITQLTFLSEIKPIWQQCLDKSALQLPFFSFAWQEAYFGTLGKKETPLILHLPHLNIITAFVKRENSLEFSGGIEVSDYLDLVGPDEYKAKAWEEILEYCKNNQIPLLKLANVPESSPTLKFFQDLSRNTFAKIKTIQQDTTPIFVLPKTYEEYLAGLDRKARHELGRKLRKFEREHLDVQISVSPHPDQDVQILFDLMRLDGRKQKFLNPDYEEFFHLLMRNFSKNIILQILYVNALPAAALFVLTTPADFLLYNSGFDQTKFSGAGFYIKAESVRYAIEKGFEQYNFLQGRERYKYELGGQDFGVYEILVDLT